MTPLILIILILAVAASLMFMLYACQIQYRKEIAFLFSLSTLFILVYSGTSIFYQDINIPWFKALSIDFHLKVDHLSLLFLYLTAIIFPIVILSVKSREDSSSLYGLILALQTFLVIFFTARDLVVFTLFWEATLLPIYFILTMFGGEGRKMAALKFIVYMIAGSFLLIVAVLSLYFSAASQLGTGSFNLDVLKNIADALPQATLLFTIFLLAFAVKTPLFPFHAWLPNAYTEATTAGTIILSAVLSKMGIYGMFRIGSEFFPSHIQAVAVYALPLAIFSVLYGAIAAWMQKDYKRLIAYSSFSHVNFIVAGFFVPSLIGHTGALLQVLNHGVIITGLFLVASFLEDRIQTKALYAHRGLAKYLPRLCWLTLVFILASVSLPGTNNFIGELLIFIGIFAVHPWYTPVLGLSIILSVVYSLRYMELNFFGKDVKEPPSFSDIGAKEMLIVAPLVIIIFLIGIYPQIILPYLGVAK